MFLVPVFALLSTIRRDLFAVSFTTLRDFCRPEFPSPASGLSFEQKTAKPHESCQALQNEDLQKWSHNSREMNTYEKIGGGRVLRSAEIAEPELGPRRATGYQSITRAGMPVLFDQRRVGRSALAGAGSATGGLKRCEAARRLCLRP